jgi:hypothetical protein
VDRHRFDANPDPNFHVNADPDPNPDLDWHQNDEAPYADPTPSFTHVGRSDFFFTFSPIIASLQCSFYLEKS